MQPDLAVPLRLPLQPRLAAQLCPALAATHPLRVLSFERALTDLAPADDYHLVRIFLAILRHLDNFPAELIDQTGNCRPSLFGDRRQAVQETLKTIG